MRAFVSDVGMNCNRNLQHYLMLKIFVSVNKGLVEVTGVKVNCGAGYRLE